MGIGFLLTLILMASPGKAMPQRTARGSPVLLNNHDAKRLLTRQVIPDYPPLAKINYIQGPVDLRVVVTPTGKVGSVHVLRGEALLAAAALRAIRRWHYRPYIGAHGPVSFETRVHIKFALRIRRLSRLPLHPAKDLARQVHPPQILQAPAGKLTKRSVRMRVLVGENGSVLDAEPVGGTNKDAAPARSTLLGWKFRPARWGTLAVPWYLDVEVPVAGRAANADPASPASR
jgi:TonB family protein